MATKYQKQKKPSKDYEFIPGAEDRTKELIRRADGVVVGVLRKDGVDLDCIDYTGNEANPQPKYSQILDDFNDYTASHRWKFIARRDTEGKPLVPCGDVYMATTENFRYATWSKPQEQVFSAINCAGKEPDYPPR